MQIHGKLIKILEAEGGTSKNGKAWSKQSCIVKTDNKYNNIVCITAFGDDKIENLNKVRLSYSNWNCPLMIVYSGKMWPQYSGKGWPNFNSPAFNIYDVYVRNNDEGSPS